MRHALPWILGFFVVVFTVAAVVLTIPNPQPASITNCIQHFHTSNAEEVCKQLREANPDLFDDLYKEPRP